jgi:hypothetical protein
MSHVWKACSKSEYALVVTDTDSFDEAYLELKKEWGNSAQVRSLEYIGLSLKRVTNNSNSTVTPKPVKMRVRL